MTELILLPLAYNRRLLAVSVPLPPPPLPAPVVEAHSVRAKWEVNAFYHVIVDSQVHNSGAGPARQLAIVKKFLGFCSHAQEFGST